MKEKKAIYINGYLGVIITILMFILSFYLIFLTFSQEKISPFIIGSALMVLSFIMLSTLTVVQPNRGLVILFFGKYIGTIRENGVFMTIPFTTKRQVSLKARNFSTKTLKVNDVDGNPIDIAAVIVFRVVETAKAVFDVDYYESFVETQSETALRHVATKYPYDGEDDEESLRKNTAEVSHELKLELQDRLEVAGVEVMDARLTHLSYAEEIASAMLQKQQAKAILSARKLIVEGAVTMVQNAIERLEEEEDLGMSNAAKTQMINNLLVSIISEKGSQPTISLDAVSGS